MVKMKSLRLSTDHVERGRWCVFAEGLRLLIGSVESKAYATAQERLQRDKLRGVTDPETRARLVREANTEAAAETLLLGWDGLEDDDGKPIPYSIGRALEILRDPLLPDVARFVWAEASETARYRVAAFEEAAKN